MISNIKYSFQFILTLYTLHSIVKMFTLWRIGLDSFLWIDPTRNEDEIMARPDTTANQLKKTITPYYLRSCIMCLSRMSTALHKIFQNEVNYYNKGLLTERESNSLCCRSRSESWIEKWTAPLLCIKKLENNLSLDGSKQIMVKDINEGLYKHQGEFTSRLEMLQNYYEYRIPRSIIRVLTVAIYVNLALGAIAGQEFTRVVALEDSGGYYRDFSFIFYDFSMFALIQFLALFGWLKTATDLSCPFGSDRYGNI